jgi:uncharacterized protein
VLSDFSNSIPLPISIFGSDDIGAVSQSSRNVLFSRSGRRRMMTNSTKGTAMVTGASSGMGAIYADRLARRGYDLVLVARERERLNDLAMRLAEETGRTVKVVAVELGEEADLRRIETLLRSDLGISLLVNNAGVGAGDPPSESDADRVDDMIALNIRALTRLTCTALPGFFTRGGGAIINIASGLAIAPEILSGVHAGTKAFLLSLSLSLHEELAGKNVHVQFWEIAGDPIEHLPDQIVMQAGDMIDAALAGLDHDERVTLPSPPNTADWQPGAEMDGNTRRSATR